MPKTYLCIDEHANIDLKFKGVNFKNFSDE